MHFHAYDPRDFLVVLVDFAQVSLDAALELALLRLAPPILSTPLGDAALL